MTSYDQFPNPGRPASEYDQIFDALETRLAERDRRELDAEQNRLMEMTHGFEPAGAEGETHSRSYNYWEAVKRGAGIYSRHIVALAVAYRSRWGETEEPDGFDYVFDRVRTGIRRTGMEWSYDAASLVSLPSVQELNGQAEIGDPVITEKAAQATDILLSTGVYNFLQQHNPAQLSAAVDYMQEYTQRIRDFDPHNAGLPQAKAAIRTACAALAIDYVTKPEFRHIFPERAVIFRAAHSALAEMRRTEVYFAVKEFYKRNI